jgi:hypothetical protein
MDHPGEPVHSGEVVLRQRSCRKCHAVFWICSHCDRGQSYCGAFCRVPARRQQLRRANRRHQRSPEGRADHRDRQREYRHRHRQVPARVTDQGSASISSPCNIPSWESRSAITATRSVSAAAFTFTRTLPEWGKESDQQRPPFLRCIQCGRPGRFVDPFPKIPRF